MTCIHFFFFFWHDRDADDDVGAKSREAKEVPEVGLLVLSPKQVTTSNFALHNLVA